MSSSAIQLNVVNGAIQVSPIGDSQTVVGFSPWPYWIGKILLFVSYYFPCMGEVSEIEVNQQFYYVSSDTIKTLLHSTWNCSNTSDLKNIALSYFTHMQVPNQDRSQRDARTLFTMLHSMRSSSGFHVDIDFSSQEGTGIALEGMGQDGAEMVMPDASRMRECQCCQTVFEHTFRNSNNALCQEISTLIERFDYFAVLSPNGTLLIVPDTRKAHVRAFEHQNLWQLNQAQLEKLTCALWFADALLLRRFPTYDRHVKFHQGLAGNQTRPIIHARFRLPDGE